MTLEKLELSYKTARAELLPARGGLLTSLRLRAPSSGELIDTLYMPPDFVTESSGWPSGGAPWMFPFAGRVFNQGLPFRYTLGENVYDMPLHGFAYAATWKLISRSDHRVSLELTGNTHTLQLFPYEFALRAHYELSESQLQLAVEVENFGKKSDDPSLSSNMPFALGLHPYFAHPFRAENPDDYVLVSKAQEKFAVTPAGAAGRASPFPGEIMRDPDGRGVLLEQPLMRNLILGAHTDPEICLLHPQLPFRLRLAWSPREAFSYVVLWGTSERRFYCIEPWVGLPDAVSTGAGLLSLAPGISWSAQLQIALI